MKAYGRGYSLFHRNQTCSADHFRYGNHAVAESLQ